MKTLLACLFGLAVLAAVLPPASAFEDVDAHPSCAVCGMDREAFGHSRMLVEFGDGRAFGTCSLRCAARILQAEGEARSVEVADYNTRELVGAEEAAWVIGGRRPGVMTPVAKWAFRDGRDADRFLDEFGGARAPYREALRKALGEIE